MPSTIRASPFEQTYNLGQATTHKKTSTQGAGSLTNIRRAAYVPSTIRAPPLEQTYNLDQANTHKKTSTQGARELWSPNENRFSTFKLSTLKPIYF